MFCANCGTKNEDGAMFCAGCGQKIEGTPVAMAPVSEVNAAPAPAPVEFTGLEDEATVAAFFNPATGTATPVAPVTPVAPAPEAYVAPAAPVAPVAPAPEAYVAPAAPVAPAPEAYVAPAAPVAPAPEAYVAPAAPVAPAPEAYAQPSAPVAPEAYTQPGAPVAPVAPTPAAPAEKKPVNKAIFFIIGGIAAVIIIGIIIAAVANLGGGSGKKIADDWNSWYNVEDEVTNIVYGSTVFKDTIDGKAYSASSSADNKVKIYYTEETEYFVVTSNGKINSLGEDLKSVSLSADGSTVSYIDDDDTLFTYKVSNGSKNKIAEDVYIAVLSPSGKSVAYVVDDDDTMVLYVNNGKNDTKLSKNSYPIGLSDDCKYIYYTSNDALYVTNLKDNNEKIDKDLSGSYFFNSDHTQLMYTSNNGVFVTVKGGDKQKVSGKTGAPLLLSALTGEAYHYDSVGGAYTYSKSSLANQYYYLDDSIIYVDKKWESDKAISNIDDLQVSDNLKTVYYTNANNTLYVCKLDGKYEATKIKADVTNFSATRDGSAVYYIVDNDSLYYQKGKSDSKKIATDAHRVSVSADNIAYFMTDYDSEDSTGMLYYSKNGKDKEKVASDCYSFFCDINCVVYYADYEYNSTDTATSYSYSYTYSVYLAKSGTKFTKILEDIGYKYSYTY